MRFVLVIIKSMLNFYFTSFSGLWMHADCCLLTSCRPTFALAILGTRAFSLTTFFDVHIQRV